MTKEFPKSIKGRTWFFGKPPEDVTIHDVVSAVENTVIATYEDCSKFDMKNYNDNYHIHGMIIDSGVGIDMFMRIKGDQAKLCEFADIMLESVKEWLSDAPFTPNFLSLTYDPAYRSPMLPSSPRIMLTITAQ